MKMYRVDVRDYETGDWAEIVVRDADGRDATNAYATRAEADRAVAKHRAAFPFRLQTRVMVI